MYEELEEVLIMGDLGVQATEEILEDLRAKVKEQHIKEPKACRELLIETSGSRWMWGKRPMSFLRKKPL